MNTPDTQKLKAAIIPSTDTLENWEKTDPILPLGMLIAVKNAIGFETRFKIGLGNRKFSETPWLVMVDTLPAPESTEDTPEGE